MKLNVLFACALLSCQSVFANDMEIGVGYCHLSKPPDGTWWIDGGGTKMDLTNPCGQIGFRMPVNDSLGVRLAYVHLGHQKLFGKSSVHDSEQKQFPTGESCDPETQRGCTALFGGHQKVQGISFGLDWRQEWLSIEGGMYFYHAKNTLDIAMQTGQAVNFSWHHTDATPYIGGALHYGPVSLSLRAYAKIKSQTSEFVGFTDDMAYQWGMTLTFPLN